MKFMAKINKIEHKQHENIIQFAWWNLTRRNASSDEDIKLISSFYVEILHT